MAIDRPRRTCRHCRRSRHSAFGERTYDTSCSPTSTSTTPAVRTSEAKVHVHVKEKDAALTPETINQKQRYRSVQFAHRPAWETYESSASPGRAYRLCGSSRPAARNTRLTDAWAVPTPRGDCRRHRPQLARTRRRRLFPPQRDGTLGHIRHALGLAWHRTVHRVRLHACACEPRDTRGAGDARRRDALQFARPGGVRAAPNWQAVVRRTT